MSSSIFLYPYINNETNTFWSKRVLFPPVVPKLVQSDIKVGLAGHGASEILVTDDIFTVLGKFLKEVL